MADELPPVTRLERYERRTERPMVAAALVFLLVYAVPIIWPDASGWILTTCAVASLGIWVIFVVDLLARAWLSGRPGGYLIRHPIDVVLVALPMLRPLRVLRVFLAAQVLINRGARMSFGRTMAAVLVGTGFLMLVGALAMLDVERGAEGANIQNFGDALWWAGVTITTVGYGDAYPVTGQGQIVAFCMMLVGISLIGVITATVAAWFVQRVRRDEDIDTAEVLTELRALRAEIEELRQQRTGSTDSPAFEPPAPYPPA